MHRQHAHAPHFELSPIRIAGTSAAIALHAVVLMMLMVPTQWVPPKPEPVDEYLPVPLVEIVPPPPPIRITPVRPPVAQPPTPTRTAPSKPDVPPQQVALTTEPSTEVVATVAETSEITAPPSFQQTVVAELTADIAPAPPYPPMALREGITGQVMLRITVDAEGRPIDGRVEKSSGSRLLDQTALRFVLANWHFNAAIQGGSPVASVALVPIVFTLNR
jgi:protein TonB